MVPKGSVAVDGVSLTLVDVAGGRFRVALIPTTLAETTLGELSAGDRVNIETDLIGKYVLQYLHGMAGGRTGTQADAAVTLQKLREAGFA
jgi:riboflavin synthase